MSAVDTAFHGLRHMIASGRLVAGQRFPAENELCDELGVSRGSLREAVRMLAALGIIESRHGSGTYVSMLRPEEIIGSLSLTVDLLPLDGLLQMYELRRVLETHARATRCAPNSPNSWRRWNGRPTPPSRASWTTGSTNSSRGRPGTPR